MKTNRYRLAVLLLFMLITCLGCHPRVDLLAKAEKGFIKMIDRTARKLDLNPDQKVQLEKLKGDVRRNFEEGRVKRTETMKAMREEGIKENPDIRKMTSLLQEELRDGTERINRAFDLMLDFQKNLNEAQRKKLSEMISHHARKWNTR